MEISELEFLKFFMNNRLSDRYSIRDLRREIQERMDEIKSINGCGADIKAPFDSEYPEKGGDIVKCCKTWKCVGCSMLNDAPKQEGVKDV